MYSKFVAGSIIVGTFVFASVCASSLPAVTLGEKQDNGLGSLPRYSKWHAHPELSHLVVRDVSATEQLAAATR